MTNRTGRGPALGAMIIVAAGAFGPAGAAEITDPADPAPIACGTVYEVQPGDTLHSIALRAYGEGKYPPIYLANQDVLPDKSRLFVGIRLLIPCLDGSGPATRAEAEAPAGTAPDAPAPDGSAAGGALAIAASRAAPPPADLLANVETGSIGNPSAPEVACGSTYRVREGDTLYNIALRAYGEARYPPIYLANQGVIPDMSQLPVGARLSIPCIDGVAPATRAAMPVPRLAMLAPADEPLAGRPFATAAQPLPPEPAGPGAGIQTPHDATRLALPDPLAAAGSADIAGPGAIERRLAAIGAERLPIPLALRDPIRLLTGDGFEPLIGRTLPGGGMLGELVGRSIRAADPEQEFTVTFVNDWAAHLDGLLPGGAMDIGFPWPKPDCDGPGARTSQAATLCTGFEFSAPLYELHTVWFETTSGSGAALTGKRICRSMGAQAYAAARAGIAGTPRSEQDAPSATACFRALMAGAADLVAALDWEAARALDTLRIRDRVHDLPALATTRTLHAVIAKSNPRGAAYLALIDAGLGQVMLSGDWFRIVAQRQGERVAAAN